MSKADTNNISARVAVLAQSIPANRAIIDAQGSLTFAELDVLCRRTAAALEGLGISRGTRVALMVPPSREFFTLTFALFRLGAVPVLIDPGIGWRHLGRCLEGAAPEAFIGVPKAHVGRLLGRWAKNSIRHLVTVGRRWFWGGHSHSLLLEGASLRHEDCVRPAEKETAAILFTSGSTGVPKGAVYTHANFCAQIQALRDHFAIAPGDVSVATFPLFALFDVALGQTVVLPKMDASRPAEVDPRCIIDPVNYHRAVQLFGSPALLDRVGRYGEAHGLKFPSLKRVISAGAPVSAKVISRFSKLLAPGAIIHTPYGATEALPVSCIESPEILGETAALSAEGRGICVGRPLPHMDVRVISISDGPLATLDLAPALPAGEVGELAVRGPVVTGSYDKQIELTALAKISSEDGIFHRMGDLGSFDEKGRIWFCGRKSQRVETGSQILFTIACEGIFNRHPAVRRSALVGVAGSPVLCVELETDARDTQRVRAELLSLAALRPQTRAIKTVLFHDSFPVDIRHNAKIFREKLAVWAKHRLS